MFWKILYLLVVVFYLSSVVEGSLGFASVAVGETFEFDFGEEAKDIRINRNSAEEILYAGKQGKYPNVKLSDKGILTISPVTENDFGMYSATYKIEKRVDDSIIGVAPPAVVLVKKE
uniref:CopC domain-containing protein n=1 Tax=Strongyloides papillosus TaxID=174720 RepID=A0A0N5CBL6_STREA